MEARLDSHNLASDNCPNLAQLSPASGGLSLGLAISELEVGGAEKNLVRLACGLQMRGHRVHVYCLDPRPAPGLDALVVQLERAGIPCQFLGPAKWGWTPWGWARKLVHQWRVDQVQVVYSFLFRANLASTWAALARATMRLWGGHPGPKIVLGFRQADPRPVVRWLEQACLRRANATVCVSSQVAEHYAPHRSPVHPSAISPARRGQVVVIPNGVSQRPTSEERPADLLACLSSPPPTRGPLPILLAVGRLVPQKGLDQLLAVIPQVLRDLPSFQLVFIGKGDQEAELRALAERSAVRSQIHFLGWRPNPADYIGAATMLLLHSRWEGLPNVLLEAMSSGRPVVATQSHGLDDLFPPDEGVDPAGLAAPTAAGPVVPEDLAWTAEFAGWARQCQVVAADSPSDFVQAVRRIASNPELAEKLGIWNQIRVQEAFSVDRFLTSHEQVFLKLAGACQHAAEGRSANFIIP